MPIDAKTLCKIMLPRGTEAPSNREVHFDTFLNIFYLPFLLVPFGVVIRWSILRDADGGMLVTTSRQLHVFGIRIARWHVLTERVAEDETLW